MNRRTQKLLPGMGTTTSRTLKPSGMAGNEIDWLPELNTVPSKASVAIGFESKRAPVGNAGVSKPEQNVASAGHATSGRLGGSSSPTGVVGTSDVPPAPAVGCAGAPPAPATGAAPALPAAAGAPPPAPATGVVPALLAGAEPPTPPFVLLAPAAPVEGTLSIGALP